MMLDLAIEMADRDITVSMTRPGNPFYKAKAESLMKKLEAEQVSTAKPTLTRATLAATSTGSIGVIYNGERLHSALGYQSLLSLKLRSQNKVR
ncbi:transposase InsO family protein [Bradyrhizobium sp. CIR48]|uniref:integrase core domain-containing protein n=1 Tax=Bradyrhizobium sp. CIR48 TaxID=2663840 RepID=UPI0016057641|nr:integrase core domain-containing protein [Bradyrhizobium sp. CIR48]MBB4423941.1 transposase InsO family protein [Bradyrhizobium sp. CIR48]